MKSRNGFRLQVTATFIIFVMLIAACAHHKKPLEEYQDPLSLIESQDITPPPKPAPVEPPAWAETKITMEFQNALLTDVLRIIATEYKVNLAIPNDKESRVTIYLNDATIEAALDMILASVGYSYFVNGETVSIHKNDEVVSRIYHLKYAKASEIRTNLEGMSDKANIRADEQTNSLVVTDVLGNMNAYDNIIDSLDSFQPSVMIEAEIFEVTLDNLRNLGIEWESQFDGATSSVSTVSPIATTVSSLFLNYSNLGSPQVQMMLSALKRNTETHLLSSPRIVTMNGQEAKILVGERVPYVRASTATSGGNVMEEVEFVDVGIMLKVTPRIVTEENLIFIDVQPEVSKVLDQQVQGVPRIGTREASTRVAVKNNSTVIIGGLFTSDDTKSTATLPFLGRIPGLKYLFGKTNTTRSERELVVFITPHILSQEHYNVMENERNKLNSNVRKVRTTRLF
jgi:type II secretory pathway component GspD/PulD (secretin)